MSKKSKGIDRIKNIPGAGKLELGKGESAFKTNSKQLAKDKGNKRKKDIQNVKLNNNYFKNVAKSISYTIKDVMSEELMPNTFDAAKAAKDEVKFLQDNFKNINQGIKAMDGKIKGSQAYKQSQSALNNAMNDFKSGKFYNKERADKFNTEFNESYGDDIFEDGGDADFGEGMSDDDFFSDGGSDDDMFEAVGGSENVGLDDFDEVDAGKFDAGSFNTKSGNKVYVDNRKSVKVQRNYSSASGGSELDVTLTKLSMENDNRNTSVIGDLFNRHTAQTVSGLESVNDNVSQLVSFASDSISPFIETTTQFYEDNINSLKGINDTLSQTFELVKALGINQEEARIDAIESDEEKAFSGDSLNLDAYKEILKKNINQALMESGVGDINSYIGAIKEFATVSGGLGKIAANPLGMGMKFGFKKLIGSSAQSNLNDLDQYLGKIPKKINRKLLQWSNSKDSMLSFIGKIFGADNKTKADYNLKKTDGDIKKAQPWNNQDHTALVKVIPELLGLIAKNTGKDGHDLVFDYRQNKFVTKKQTLKKTQEEFLQDNQNIVGSSSMYSKITREALESKKDEKGNSVFSPEELNKFTMLREQNRSAFLTYLAWNNIDLQRAIDSLNYGKSAADKALKSDLSNLVGGEKNLNDILNYFNIIKVNNPEEFKEEQGRIFDLQTTIAKSIEKIKSDMELAGLEMTEEQLRNFYKNTLFVQGKKNKGKDISDVSFEEMNYQSLHDNSEEEYRGRYNRLTKEREDLNKRKKKLNSSAKEKLVKNNKKDKLIEQAEKLGIEVKPKMTKADLAEEILKKDKLHQKQIQELEKELEANQEALEAAKEGEYKSSETGKVAKFVDTASHYLNEGVREGLGYEKNRTTSAEDDALYKNYSADDKSAVKAVNSKVSYGMNNPNAKGDSLNEEQMRFKDSRISHNKEDEDHKEYILRTLEYEGRDDEYNIFQKRLKEAEEQDKKDPSGNYVHNVIQKAFKKVRYGDYDKFAGGGSKTIVSKGHRPAKKGEKVVSAITGDRMGEDPRKTPTAEIVTAHTDKDTGNAVLNVYKHSDTKRMLNGQSPAMADGGSVASSTDGIVARTINKMTSTISSAISNPLEAIKESFTDLFNFVTEKVSGFFDKIKNTVKDSNWYQKLEEKIKSKAKKKGKDLGKKSLTEAEKKINELTGGLIDTFKADKKEHGLSSALKSLVSDKLGKPMGKLSRTIFGDANVDKGKELTGKISNFLKSEGISGKNIAMDAGLGVLGSLFLPGGPIIGATLGIGTGMIAHSKTLQKFIFGEGVEDDEKNVLQKYASKFKGLVKDNKSVIAGGVLGSLFLPGGPIVGALVGGFGTKFVKDNSDRVKRMLFGTIDEEGNGRLGIVTKALMQIRKNLVNPFAKFGAKASKGLIGLLDKNLLRPLGKKAQWIKGFSAMMKDNLKKAMLHPFKLLGERIHNIGASVAEFAKKQIFQRMKNAKVFKKLNNLRKRLKKRVTNKLIGTKDKETGMRHGGIGLLTTSLNKVTAFKQKHGLDNLTDTMIKRQFLPSDYKENKDDGPSPWAKKATEKLDGFISGIDSNTAKINKQLEIHNQNTKEDIKIKKEFRDKIKILERDRKKEIADLQKSYEQEAKAEIEKKYKNEDGSFKKEKLQRFSSEEEAKKAYLEETGRVKWRDKDDKKFKKWEKKNRTYSEDELNAVIKKEVTQKVAANEDFQKEMKEINKTYKDMATMIAYDSGGVPELNNKGEVIGVRAAQTKNERDFAEKSKESLNSGNPEIEGILKVQKEISKSNTFQEATQKVQEKSAGLLDLISNKIGSIEREITHPAKQVKYDELFADKEDGYFDTTREHIKKQEMYENMFGEEKSPETAYSGGSFFKFAEGGSIELNADGSKNADGKAGESYADQVAEEREKTQAEQETRQTDALEAIVKSLGNTGKKSVSVLESLSGMFGFVGVIVTLTKKVFKGISTAVKTIIKLPKILKNIWTGIKQIPNAFKNFKDKISGVKQKISDKIHGVKRVEKTKNPLDEVTKTKFLPNENKALLALQMDADAQGLTGSERAVYIANGMANISTTSDIVNDTTKKKTTTDKDPTQAKIEEEKLATEEAVNKEKISNAQKEGEIKTAEAQSEAATDKVAADARNVEKENATTATTRKEKLGARYAAWKEKQTAKKKAKKEMDTTNSDSIIKKKGAKYAAWKEKQTAKKKAKKDISATGKAASIEISGAKKAVKKEQTTESLKSGIDLTAEGGEASVGISGAVPVFGPAIAAALVGGLTAGIVSMVTDYIEDANSDEDGDTEADESDAESVISSANKDANKKSDEKEKETKKATDKVQEDAKKKAKENKKAKKADLKKRAEAGDTEAQAELDKMAKEDEDAKKDSDSDDSSKDSFDAKALFKKLIKKDKNAQTEFRSIATKAKKGDKKAQKKLLAIRKASLDYRKELQKKRVEKLKNTAKKVFKYTPAGIAISGAKKAFSTGKKVVGAVGSGLKKVGSGLWSGVKKVGSGLWSGAKKVGSGLWSGVKTAGGAVAKVGKGVWGGLKKVGGGILGGVKKVGKGLFNGAKSMLTKGSTRYFLYKILKSTTGIYKMLGKKFGYFKDSSSTNTATNKATANTLESNRKLKMADLEKRAAAGDTEAQAELEKMKAEDAQNQATATTTNADGTESNGTTTSTDTTGKNDDEETANSGKKFNPQAKPKKFGNEVITAVLNGTAANVRNVGSGTRAIVNAINTTNQILIKGFQLDTVVAEGSDVSIASKASGLFGNIVKALGFGKGNGSDSASKANPDESKSISGNSVPYYSQDDPRWSNYGYGEEDMETDGCGPTAMAMVASKMTGSEIDPKQMAALAQTTGNVDERGTNFEFIDEASTDMDLKNSKSVNPSGSQIRKALKNGPLILSGKSNVNKVGTPYTKSGHYIVATGISPDGKVIVQDPRGEAYNTTYDPNVLANQTLMSWNFGSESTKQDEDQIIPFGYGGEKSKSKKKKNKSSSKSSKIDKAVDWAVGIANDDTHGYDQTNRNGPDYDCSSLVSGALNKGGFNINSGLSTSGLQSALAKDSSEFKDVTTLTKNAKKTSALRKGDVQVTPGEHSEMYVGDGKNVGAHSNENGGITGGKTGDQTGKEINVADVWGSYSYVYRPKGKYTDGYDTDDTTSSSDTSSKKSSDTTTTSSDTTSSSDDSSSGGSIISDLTAQLSGVASSMFTGVDTYAKAQKENEELEQNLSSSTTTDSTNDDDDTGTTTGDGTSTGSAISKNSSVDDIVKTDITQLPHLNIASIKKIIKKRLKGQNSVVKAKHAKGIYKAQKKTGISDLALLGIATQESGLGTSNIAKNKHNLWGWGAVNDNPYGGASAYSTIPKAFKTYAKDLKRLYYKRRGMKSLKDIGDKYGYAFLDNGSVDTSWDDSIGSIIKGYLGYGLQTDGTDDTGSTGGTSESGSSESNKKYIWNYFKKKKVKEKAIAAIMGNLQTESGFYPDRKQGDIPHSDASAKYAQSVDNGSLSRKSFANDSIGFGFPQWTYYTRKEQLYDAAKKANKSIADLGFQTKYLYKDLKKYNSVNNLMKNGGDIQSLTTTVMKDYEQPADQSTTAQKTRGNQAKSIYKQFHGKGEGSSKPPKVTTGWGKGEGSATISEPKVTVQKYDYFKDTSDKINNAINASNLSSSTNIAFDMIIEYLEQISQNTQSTAESSSKLLDKEFTATLNVDNSSKVDANINNSSDGNKTVTISGGNDSNLFTGSLPNSNSGNQNSSDILDKIALIASGN